MQNTNGTCAPSPASSQADPLRSITPKDLLSTLGYDLSDYQRRVLESVVTGQRFSFPWRRTYTASDRRRSMEELAAVDGRLGMDRRLRWLTEWGMSLATASGTFIACGSHPPKSSPAGYDITGAIIDDPAAE